MVEQVVRAHRRSGVQWLLNRDIELARALSVGVHLGSEQLQQLSQRPLPEGQLVAASCHDLQQLQAAQQLGCDFAVLGPVQATASHPDAAPLGWDAFAELRAQVSLPIYALGGMGSGHITEARRHGGQGIAAIRGLNTRTAAAIPARWRHVQRCPATSAPGAGRPAAARQPVRARSLAPDHPAPAPARCPVPAADTPAQRPPAAAAPMIPAGRGCAARRRRRPRPTGTARTAGSRRC
ncbi:hypothetical protein G6F50_013415 [Rhizopus delemar]|uniref:Thiamine phosphate synthase/TenI domain-containing protein n=1 Tax=Rhizopus delemar TaxID=936053 RepID=A0A9P6YHQ5_9FUNG|nr:hypothetical protein G6F50_013415 [Rhizopus delemar]